MSTNNTSKQAKNYHSIKLICDAMLGKLARTLRFLGFDTLYVGELEQSLSSALPDPDILELARETGRFILTRDEMFSRMDSHRIILIPGGSVEENLNYLKSKQSFSFTFVQEDSRCYKCNKRVKKVPKKSIEKMVNEKTFEHHHAFFQCPSCNQVYWKGAHFKRDEDGILSRFSGVIEDEIE
ncbi:hypothetical protein GF325_12620 [Candidatus Bathyarchaeota archaeon]|nr:hypothetical protein [Candidatus Bathyarchaeota archaeon]